MTLIILVLEKRTYKENILPLIGQSVLLWCSYLRNNTCTEILSESSLRFPIIECLERRTQAQDINIEHLHPSFKMRRMDMVWNMNESYYALELKYLKDYLSAEKVQLIYNDVFRLSYSCLDGYESYLLICGRKDDFKSAFKKSKRYNRIKIAALNKPKSSTSNSLNDVFSIKKKSPVKQISFNNESHKEYKEFCETYKWKDNERILDPLSIRTELIYLSKDSENAITHTVAIWKIKIS